MGSEEITWDISGPCRNCGVFCHEADFVSKIVIAAFPNGFKDLVYAKTCPFCGAMREIDWGKHCTEEFKQIQAEWRQENEWVSWREYKGYKQ